MMAKTEKTGPGLLWALVCQPDGTCSETALESLPAQVDSGFLWLHFNRWAPETQEWLEERSGLSEHEIDALLEEDTRPRFLSTADGLLVILRGVNLNPGAEPLDMVSVRLWIEPNRVISLQGPNVMAVADLERAFREGSGPYSTGDLLASLANGLVEKMRTTITGVEDEYDEIEEDLVEGLSEQASSRLSSLRHDVLSLRRFVAPQRDVVEGLTKNPPGWFGAEPASRLLEVSNNMTRYVENLDSLRDRLAVSHEECVARMQDRLNRNMYVLSLVAAIFLPLGFLTGLLGINVGGMPGVDSPAAFLIVCGLLGMFGLAEFLLLRWRKWW